MICSSRQHGCSGGQNRAKGLCSYGVYIIVKWIRDKQNEWAKYIVHAVGRGEIKQRSRRGRAHRWRQFGVEAGLPEEGEGGTRAGMWGTGTGRGSRALWEGFGAREERWGGRWLEWAVRKEQWWCGRRWPGELQPKSVFLGRGHATPWEHFAVLSFCRLSGSGYLRRLCHHPTTSWQPSRDLPSGCPPSPSLRLPSELWALTHFLSFGNIFTFRTSILQVSATNPVRSGCPWSLTTSQDSTT